jgi:cytochrome c oxidase assembly factor CtaG
MPAADRTRSLRIAALGAGLTATVIALGPLEATADESLAAHMAQHVLLISLAAPLLVTGSPVVAGAWAHRRWHAPLRALSRAARGRRWAIWMTVAAAAHVLAVWTWHLPGPYQSALRTPALHALEHLSFFGTACVLWWAVTALRRGPSAGTGVLALFAVALPATALGALMALAHTPWYPFYGMGRSALADQQIAGAVMWGVGGMVAAGGGAGLFAAWLSRAERTAERLPPPSRLVRRAGARP